jgi:hypothetical protein
VCIVVPVASVISQERAEQILAPHIDAISVCLWNAWDHWRATDLPLSVSARARANLVYDFAVEEGRRTLKGREGLVLTEERGFLAVNVDEKLLLRFKKYRKGLATSGISTRQKRLFDQQQLSIAGMEQVTGIIAGYELDEFQREIKRVAITCRVGKSLVWTIDVARPEVSTVVPIGTPDEARPKTQVRSARSKEDSAQEGS